MIALGNIGPAKSTLRLDCGFQLSKSSLTTLKHYQKQLDNQIQ